MSSYFFLKYQSSDQILIILTAQTTKYCYHHSDCKSSIIDYLGSSGRKPQTIGDRNSRIGVKSRWQDDDDENDENDDDDVDDF